MNVSQMDCGNQNPQYVSSFNTIERRNRVVFHIDNFLIVNRVNLSIIIIFRLSLKEFSVALVERQS